MNTINVKLNVLNFENVALTIEQTFKTEEEGIKFANLFNIPLSYFGILPRKKLKDLSCYYNVTKHTLNWDGSVQITEIGDKVICYKHGMRAEKFTKNNVYKLFTEQDDYKYVLIEDVYKKHIILDIKKLIMDQILKYCSNPNIYIVKLDNTGETFIVEE